MKIFSRYQFIICKVNYIASLVIYMLLLSICCIENSFSRDLTENNKRTDYHHSISNASDEEDNKSLVDEIEQYDNPSSDVEDNNSLIDETEQYDNQASDIEDDNGSSDETNQDNIYTIKNAIDDVYGNIFTRSRTEEELVGYLNTLTPDDSGLKVGISDYVAKSHQNIVYNRILETRNNYNTIKCQSLDSYRKNRLDIWGMTSFGSSHKKSIKHTIGYNNKSNHIITGIDQYVSNYLLGISLGLDRSIGGTFTPENIKRDHNISQDSLLVSIYAGSYLVNSLFCSAIASLGYSRVKANRLRDAAKMNANYRTKFNKYNLSASYEFDLFMLNIEPELVARLTTINIDAYHNIPENSRIDKAQGEFHNKVKDYIFDIGVGINLTQTWILSECFITPKIKATLYRNMNKTPTVTIDTRFMFESYKSDIINKSASILEAVAGLDISFKKINLSIYYNVSKSKYYNDNSWMIKVNMPF